MFLFFALGQFFNGKIINNSKFFLNWQILVNNSYFFGNSANFHYTWKSVFFGEEIVFSSKNSTKSISKTISTFSQITLIFSEIPWIGIIRQNQWFLEKKLYVLWIWYSEKSPGLLKRKEARIIILIFAIIYQFVSFFDRWLVNFVLFIIEDIRCIFSPYDIW